MVMLRRMSLTSSHHKALLTLHVTTAVGVLGADLALLTLDIAGARGVDPATIYPAAQTLGEWLIAPLAVAALFTGILLAALSDWGLWRYLWVATKLSITAVLTILVFALVLPKLGSAAQDATAAGHAVVQSKRTLLEIIPIVASTLLLVNVALAVTKPAVRLGSRHGVRTPDRASV